MVKNWIVDTFRCRRRIVTPDERQRARGNKSNQQGLLTIVQERCTRESNTQPPEPANATIRFDIFFYRRNWVFVKLQSDLRRGKLSAVPQRVIHVSSCVMTGVRILDLSLSAILSLLRDVRPAWRHLTGATGSPSAGSTNTRVY